MVELFTQNGSHLEFSLVKTDLKVFFKWLIKAPCKLGANLVRIRRQEVQCHKGYKTGSSFSSSFQFLFQASQRVDVRKPGTEQDLQYLHTSITMALYRQKQSTYTKVSSLSSLKAD